MVKLFTSLVFSLLACLSAAQFAVYPICVQPLLYSAFPASCLSVFLSAQNTCLCKAADAFGSDFVTGIYQKCGCADLQETVQLASAYCTQVGIDIGPAFGVFIQDDTPCDGSTGSGASTGIIVGTTTTASSATSTSISVGPSTQSSGDTATGTGGGSSTQSSGDPTTGTSGGASTSTGSAKSSDANKGLIIGQIVEIVVGVTGGILALW
jgi:hypothetical protein